MPTRSRTPALHALGAFFPLVAAAAVLAQQNPAAEAPGVRLSGTPLRVASTGLIMHVPEGSTSQTTSFGTTSVTQIQPLEDIGVIMAQGRQSTDTTLTPKQVGDGVIEEVLRAYGGEPGAAGQIARSRARVLSRNSSLVLGSLNADRFYVELPSQNDSDPAPVRGYTLVSPTPGRMVIFELHTTAPRLERARQVYETCVATATFEDPGDLASRRASAVRAGVRLFENFTPDDYREVFESFGTRWERLHTPSKTGADIDATEHGYRRLKAWVGRRGELTPEKDPSRWTADEETPGYLLQIDALLLDGHDLRVDTQAVYFLSTDRAQEAWTVRMAIRQGGQVNRWTETGARSDHSMSVTTAHGSAAPTVVRPLVQGEGYLSMVETYMLGPLLVRGAVPADFAFYSYQSREGTIRLRTDSAENTGAGTWRISSRMNEDAPAQVGVYTEEGEPIRTELADGRVWEPTSYDRLVRLWRDKGLPLD